MANTALSSNLGYIAWESETSFAISSDDTYTTGVTIRDDQIDLSGLQREMVDPGGVYQRLNEHDLYRLGAFNLGTFSFTMDLTGMGATTAGALTETNLSKLLAHAVGATSWSNVGTAAITSGTTTQITDAGATIAAGSIVRVGDLGDGYCEGQASVASSASSPFDLLVALPGTPQANDNLYAMGMVYPSTSSNVVLTSDGSTNNNTLRFVLMTANLAYVARGCACTGITINGLSPGEIPQITFEFSCVAWNPISVTFPSATALADKTPVPCANGSVFLQTAGTTTRAVVHPLEISLSVGQGMTARPGPGGANTGQNMVGWHRVPAETTLSLTVEAEAQTASPSHWLTANPTTARHCLITCNTTDGASLALYFPRLLQTANPTQGSTNGLNTRTFTYRAATGTTTTNDLTLSNWRLGMG